MQLIWSFFSLLSWQLFLHATSGVEAVEHKTTLSAEDIIRIRASTDESVSTFVQWEGEAYIYKPGTQPTIAFKVLGVNVARAKRLKDGSYDQLSRELQLYLDPKTNKMLQNWKNPLTNETVNVIHVQNAPIYQNIPNSTIQATRPLLGGYSTTTLNIPLAYPNPLSADPLFKPFAGAFQQLYTAIESLTFTYADKDLADTSCASVPSLQVYWTRTSPLLPWMNSPDTNATLLFIANGAKLPAGWKGLDPTLRQVLKERLPLYKDAPTERLRPGGGTTSWIFFTRPGVLEAWKNGTQFPIPE